MRVRGVVLPAFIFNLDHHLENLAVYADGLVDAWDLLDRPLFEAKVRAGVVTTAVPDGGTLSVHGLGRWVVQDGRWEHTDDALLARVDAAVRELNPDLTNLHDCGGSTTHTVEGVEVSKLGIPEASPVRVQREHLSAPTPPVWHGSSLSVFVREGDELCLADLRVFEDGCVELGRLPVPRVLDREALDAEVGCNRIVSQAPAGTRVRIHGLGSCTVSEQLRAARIDQLLLEATDIVERLSHRPDSIARCRACWDTYCASPSTETEAALRRSYEAVPMHNRRYLGEPGTKDAPIRAVLYGEEPSDAE